MEETKIVKIKGKEYTVKFPNVGEFYRIETNKQALGRGYYNTMLSNRTKMAQMALDVIDIEATLTVICPKLIDDIKVPISELGFADFKELRDIYMKEIFPFVKEGFDLLSSTEN